MSNDNTHRTVQIKQTQWHNKH